jgi:hypothetical protein
MQGGALPMQDGPWRKLTIRRETPDQNVSRQRREPSAPSARYCGAPLNEAAEVNEWLWLGDGFAQLADEAERDGDPGALPVVAAAGEAIEARGTPPAPIDPRN